MNVLCERDVLAGVRQRILEQAHQNTANIIESLRSGLSVSCCRFSGRRAPMVLRFLVAGLTTREQVNNNNNVILGF